MAKALKASPATTNDAAKIDAESDVEVGKTAIGSASDTIQTITITASEEQTGGGGDPAASTKAPSEVATDNPDGGSNDAEPAPAATAEGIAPVDAPKAVAPELVTAGSPQASEPDEEDDDPALVICQVRAIGGPRRRAGLSFDTTSRPVTRADLGGTDEKIRETLEILAADPRLSLLPPTD